MSARPPATVLRRYVDTSGASNADGRSQWPQLGGGGADTLSGITTVGTLALGGIYFEASGTLVCTMQDGASLSVAIVAAGFFPWAPASIDPATTARPFVLEYGPLGVGAR